jgi:hypothetical protein
MKTTRSLCFTNQGLVNPTSLSYIRDNNVEIVALISDGSEAAFQHMLNFHPATLPSTVQQVGIGRVPMYELRVVMSDGKLSLPHYVGSEKIYREWLSKEVAARYVRITIWDISNTNSSKVELDESATEAMCLMAYSLWSTILIAEERLSFPAAIIDRLATHTYFLQKSTMNIKLLREEIGVKSLDYNEADDTLSVEVAGDIYTIKLSLLHTTFIELILPMFNAMYGRRYRIQAAILGDTDKISEPSEMSFGDLGRVIHELEGFVRRRLITRDNPIDASDLVEFAKKVEVNDESCFWPEADQSIAATLQYYHDDIVRRDPRDDTDGSGDIE